MENNRTKAIVLHTKDHGESDRLVTFLTDSKGKLVGIAKHARRSKKRFANSLEVFNLVSLEFDEKNVKGLAFIRNSTLDYPFLGLRQDVFRMGCASLLVEAVKETSPEKGANPEIFQLLLHTLEELESNSDPLNIICLSFWRLLKLIGFNPVLDHCQICKQDLLACDNWYPAPEKGGILCQKHKKTNMYPLKKGTLVLLKKAHDLPLLKLWRLRLNRVGKMSVLEMAVDCVQYYLGHRLKSMQVLTQIKPDLTNSNKPETSTAATTFLPVNYFR